MLEDRDITSLEEDTLPHDGNTYVSTKHEASGNICE